MKTRVQIIKLINDRIGKLNVNVDLNVAFTLRLLLKLYVYSYTRNRSSEFLPHIFCPHLFFFCFLLFPLRSINFVFWLLASPALPPLHHLSSHLPTFFISIPIPSPHLSYSNIGWLKQCVPMLLFPFSWVRISM